MPIINGESEGEVPERVQEIEARLRFERLISDLSARFVNPVLERIDEKIEDALAAVREFFQVDRCGLVQVSEDRNTFQVTHAAIAEGIAAVPKGVELPLSLHPWAYDKLVRKREPLSFSKIDDLPEEANVDKKTYIEWGIRSNLNIPIPIGGEVEHIIAINSVRKECVWPEEIFPRLRLLGEILVNTIERARMRRQLQERLRFETLISDLSARLVSLPFEAIPDEINKSLRFIAEFFDSDRCSIGFFSEGNTQLVRAFEYHSAEAEPAPEILAKEQLPWYFEQLLQGTPVVLNRLEDLPPEAEKEHRLCLAKGMKSVLSVPMASAGKTIGSCTLVSAREERAWPEDLVKRLRVVTGVFAGALMNKRMEEQLHARLREIERLKLQLEKENLSLRDEIKLQFVHEEIVGRSEEMKKVLAQVEQVAPTDSTVLIQGETGVGKELLARAIHNLSRRKNRLLVTVNCASLPATLIESELFGRERGAYTGALTRMQGRFEVADGSTLFLDEIGELPLDIQSKLLRVLEEGRFERLGSTTTLQVDVRIIAATNRDLDEDVSKGRFRKDLFYRLNVFPIAVPPLRERREDILVLVWAFVRQFEKKMGKRFDTIPRKSIEALQNHPWPGNIRELRNFIERAMIINNGKTLNIPSPETEPAGTRENFNLQELERRHILDVLEKTHWRIGGQKSASEVLGMKRTTLQARMKRLGIKRSPT